MKEDLKFLELVKFSLTGLFSEYDLDVLDRWIEWKRKK